MTDNDYLRKRILWDATEFGEVFEVAYRDHEEFSVVRDQLCEEGLLTKHDLPNRTIYMDGDRKRAARTIVLLELHKDGGMLPLTDGDVLGLYPCFTADEVYDAAVELEKTGQLEITGRDGPSAREYLLPAAFRSFEYELGE